MPKLKDCLAPVVTRKYDRVANCVLMLTCVLFLSNFALGAGSPRLESGTADVVRQLTNRELVAVKPSAELGARRVVQLQLEALRRNARLGEQEGIAIAFRFASPSNRRVTGPLARFVRMIHGPTYSAMLNTTTFEVGAARLTEEGSEATVPVVITSSEGERIGFVFQLSKPADQSIGKRDAGIDDADCKCWLTDSVARIELPQEPGQSI